MNKPSVEELLNRVGKRVFVDYYYDFKNLVVLNVDNSEVVLKIKEDFTLKSKNSRTAKAKKIFKEGLHIESLKLIINSDHPQVYGLKSRAKEILDNELSTKEI
jgi:DNA repair protein RadC